MKIYYVSDNRTSANWGCRGTSIALGECLASRHEITGTLYNVTKKAAAKQAFTHGSVDEAVTALKQGGKGQAEFTPILEGIRQADAVVINGEGDMIFSGDRKTLVFLLAIIHLAADEGKKVYYTNAMASDCPQRGRNETASRESLRALKRCTGIGLRDHHSLRLLKEADPTLNPVYIPDALFQWSDLVQEHKEVIRRNGNIITPYKHEKAFGSFDFKGDYICVGGSSHARRLPKEEASDFFAGLTRQVQDLGLPVYLVETSPGDSFLRQVSQDLKVPLIPIETPIVLGALVLANARLFVSGRYHPSIMASLGGTPFISLVSNSHKMPALQEVMGRQEIEELPLSNGSVVYGRIRAQAEKLLEAGESLREELKTLSAGSGIASAEGTLRMLNPS